MPSETYKFGAYKRSVVVVQKISTYLQAHNLVQIVLYFAILINVLLAFAYMNGYPFFMPSDTRDYLQLTTNMRSLIYGYFANGSSLGITYWLTVVAQAVICTTLLTALYKYFFGTKYKLIGIGITCSLVIVSPLGYFVSLIHPDIFLSFAFICFFLLLKAKNTYVKILLLLGTSVCISMHLSFILSMALFLVGFSLWNYNKKNILYSAIIILQSVAILQIPKYIQHNSDFMLTKSYEFYIAGLIKYNIVDAHLQKYCLKKGYIICEGWSQDLYNNSSDYLWLSDSNENRVNHRNQQKKYSIEIQKNDYRRLLFDILLYRPLDVLRMLIYELPDSFFQTGEVNFFYGFEYKSEEEFPLVKIHSMIINDYYLFKNSIAYTDVSVMISLMNKILLLQIICTSIFFVIFLTLIVKRKFKYVDPNFFEFFGLLFFFVVTNSVISNLFSDAFLRYFARVNWLFTFCVFAFALLLLKKKFQRST